MRIAAVNSSTANLISNSLSMNGPVEPCSRWHLVFFAMGQILMPGKKINGTATTPS